MRTVIVDFISIYLMMQLQNGSAADEMPKESEKKV
jgi:hypothetical protein